MISLGTGHAEVGCVQRKEGRGRIYISGTTGKSVVLILSYHFCLM